MTVFDPIHYGAKADGETVDSKAIQAAIDAATANGGGTVVFLSGRRYISGSLVLKSNVFLDMEAGSYLKASTNWADITERWPGDPKIIPSDGGQIHTGTFLAAFKGTKNIGIIGTGTIDGSGEHYRGADEGPIYGIAEQRPFLIFWLGVHGVTIKDVTLYESACWTVRLGGCEDVLITGVRIRANMKLPNADGIDLDRCRRARISDCDIRCADDGISLKSCREFHEYGPTEDIVVTNCVIYTKSSALVVGVDNVGPTRNVTFSNCVIRASNRGLAVNMGEDAQFENILFSNIIVETKIAARKWWGRGEPIYVSVTPWHSDAPVGWIKNLRFTNILCKSECGAYLAADSLGQISNVVLDNVRIELSHWSGSEDTEEEGGWYDRRPTHEKERELYKPQERIAGFHLESLDNVKMRECEVVFVDQQEYWGNAVWARGCRRAKLEVEGDAGRKGLKAVDID